MTAFNPLHLLFLCLAALAAFAVAVPTSPGVAKRSSTLYTLWSSIPATQKAGGISAQWYRIDPNTPDAWGLSFMHGCTGILIWSPTHVVVGHLLQGSGPVDNCIEDPATVRRWIESLREATDMFEADDAKAIILYNSSCGKPRAALAQITSYLTDDWGLPEKPELLDYSSTTLEPKPDSPGGLAAIQWTPGPSTPHGTINVYWNSDTPAETSNY